MPNVLISIASILNCYFNNHTNYACWETMLETDTTFVIVLIEKVLIKVLIEKDNINSFIILKQDLSLK